MKYYHLTNNPNFTIKNDYNNTLQEFGIGLYITPFNNIEYWQKALGGRGYLVEVNTNTLNIINESEFPHMRIMAKEIMQAGYTVNDIKEPTGNTLNRNKFNIAVKRLYAQLKGYNAIRLFDSIEGEQIIIINTTNIKFNNTITDNDYYLLKKSIA